VIDANIAKLLVWYSVWKIVTFILCATYLIIFCSCYSIGIGSCIFFTFVLHIGVSRVDVFFIVRLQHRCTPIIFSYCTILRILQNMVLISAVGLGICSYTLNVLVRLTRISPSMRAHRMQSIKYHALTSRPWPYRQEVVDSIEESYLLFTPTIQHTIATSSGTAP
jgi:hypothetical protein